MTKQSIDSRVKKLENYEQSKNIVCILKFRPYGVHRKSIEDEVGAAKGDVTFIIGKGYAEDKPVFREVNHNEH